MNILGIDPGLQCAGWGIIDKQDNHLRYIASGFVRPNAKAPLAERLHHLHAEIQTITDRHKPDVAAIEETFVTANGQSTLKLGQARGALILSLAVAGLPLYEYSATKVKKTITGVGRADKQQVGMMVNQLLPGCEVSQADEADALAVAICHGLHARVLLKALM